MRSISRYIWKIISLWVLFSFAYTPISAKERKRDPNMKTFYGMYLDVDVLHPILHLFNSDRMGVNVDLQADFWHKLYPTVVVGYDWFDASDEYDYPLKATNNLYKVNGLYLKAGAMYNLWKKDYKKPLNPIAYIGMNYAISPRFNYKIENYPINNSYWNSSSDNFNSNGKTTGQWGEVLVGIKTPIAKSFCMGFEVMFKFALHTKDQKEGNYIIHQSYSPGFGDKESGKWGFRYTISYFFHSIKEK